ncbi:NUDIX hydrolase [Bacillus sp. SG-1]|uniref:NUDIX hydrolase n=1 Tax=Bacillus sp. SG-1 TaxID=161544 RepID=UPI00015442F0|nr:NUDIX domain-containing protein [Bacillus sp. SG-1]EDL66071.1 mutator MutT related protein [Bacillus sp. SG-1]
MEAVNKTVVAVKGLVINNGKILIVQRAMDDEVGGGTWEFPGGKIDFGEELEVALVRGVKEETCLRVSVEKLLYATSFKTDPRRQVVLLTYLCKCDSCKVILSEEHSAYKWVTEEQMRVFLSPEILSDLERSGIK